MSSQETSLNDVIHGCMPLVSSRTPPAAEGVPTQGINTRPTELAGVGPTDCRSQAQTHSNPRLTVLSSIRRPKAVTGRALNQALTPWWTL